jgi:hypothetical protein
MPVLTALMPVLTVMHVLAIMIRVGHNYIFTVYIRYFWQRNHQMYGHIRCIYTVLANPDYDACSDKQIECVIKQIPYCAWLFCE